MKTKIIILLLSVTFLTIACQKPAETHTVEEIESKYFINGDPLEVVKDAQLNSKTFLTVDNYKEFGNLELSGKTAFTERTETQTRNQNDLESVKKRNQTPTEPEKSEDLSAYFKASADGKTVVLVFGKKDSEVGLVFEQNADKSLELRGLGGLQVSVPVTPVHYSINPEKTEFSFLFMIKQKEESALVGLSFHKRAEKSVANLVKETAKRFYYLFGKGMLVGQDTRKPIVLSACGKDSEYYRDEIISGITPWKNTLNGRLEIQLQFVQQCPPVFDVNARTLQFLENRITSAAKNFINPASTLPRASFSNGYLVGGDILIFKGEYKRVNNEKDAQGYPEKLRKSMTVNVMHEFGHVLGLGHPFESSESSIMGYDEKINTITNYDIEAVTTLYPLRDAKPTN